MFRRMRDEKGFTLIELLIVVVVLGILASIAIPSYRSLTTEARVAKLDSTARAIALGLEMHRAEEGKYPNATDATALPAELDKYLVNYDTITSGLTLKYDASDETYALILSDDKNNTVTFSDGVKQ